MPVSGWTEGITFLSRWTCRRPWTRSTCSQRKEHSSDALKPCRNAIKIMVASRCPRRLFPAVELLVFAQRTTISDSRKAPLGAGLEVNTVKLLKALTFTPMLVAQEPKVPSPSRNRETAREKVRYIEPCAGCSCGRDSVVAIEYPHPGWPA
jgi:hypothetical protein